MTLFDSFVCKGFGGVEFNQIGTAHPYGISARDGRARRKAR